MSLRRRILRGTLIVAAVTLLVGVAGGAAIQREVRRAAQEDVFRQAGETAALIQDEIASTLTANPGDRPTEALRRVQTGVSRILRITARLGDHDFVEAATLTPRGLNGLTDEPELIPALLDQLGNGELDRTRFEVEVGGDAVVASVRVIPLGDQIFAEGSAGERLSLLIAIGNRQDFAIVAVVSRVIILALVIGAGLAVILAFALSRGLGRRLEDLARAARSYADGDFGARAPAEGHDELAAVGHAFNDMAADLDEVRRRERDFLMSVGHDLRTPLTTIRGYAEALNSGVVNPDDLPHISEVLHRQTGRLSRLIEDLMLLARLEAREFSLRNEPVDLAAHVKEIVEAHRVRADQVRVRVETEIQPVGMILIDPDRIGQVAGNLLDNAMRYTPEAGSVTVSLQESDGRVELTVADSGPGIDADDIPHVFERLYVAQRYQAVRPEGSGLGLSIVKELVDAMGGDVRVTSEPAVGTTVTVVLGI